MFENVKTIVEAAGLTMEHVVYTQVYLTDASDEGPLNQVWKQYFPKSPPARSTIGVATTARHAGGDERGGGARPVAKEADRAARLSGQFAALRGRPCGRSRRISPASSAGREADHALAVTGETWTQMRAVNVDAGFHLARELARKLMAAEKPGSFLFLTSLHAETPRNLPHYSTSKAALAMLVKELAKTFGRFGIRVNALVPGAIAAGGFVADPALAKHIPLGRLGRAEDLAPMALAVLSNRVSAYVTGAAIVVDGGLSLTNWFDPPALDDL